MKIFFGKTCITYAAILYTLYCEEAPTEHSMTWTSWSKISQIMWITKILIYLKMQVDK